MGRGEVGIAQSHDNGFVSYQFLYRAQIYSTHHESRGKSMTKIVPVKVLKARLLTSRIPYAVNEVVSVERTLSILASACSG